MIGRFATFALAASVCLSACAGSDTPATEAERYPGPWGPVEPRVMLTIRQNGYDCHSDSFQRRAVGSTEEFLVYCMRSRWRAFIVWPTLGRIEGPDDAWPYRHCRQSSGGLTLPPVSRRVEGDEHRVLCPDDPALEGVG